MRFVIDALRAGGETRGVIGERARSELKLLPSTAYRSGLGALGFRLFHGTHDQYHRSFDGYRLLVRGAPCVSDDEDPVASIYRNWHPTLDELGAESPDFLERATFALTVDEGAFVRELVLRHVSRSFRAREAAPPDRPPRRAAIDWQTVRRCRGCGGEQVDCWTGHARYLAGCSTCSDRRSKHRAREHRAVPTATRRVTRNEEIDRSQV